ncbi:MAG: hypothetical protein KDD68_09840, partial [Bdellovibrionales bacterium]|nr:hypothetical protein [Bdellovibrionales bacterium]
MRSRAWTVSTTILASAVAFLYLFAFQNCEFESTGNGGGYTGFQEESAYGPFNPGSTVLLPNYGQENQVGAPANGADPRPVTLRDYYLFSQTKNCLGTSNAQESAVEVVSFLQDRTVLTEYDCGSRTNSSDMVQPIVSSYNPWFVILDGKIYQLLNQAVSSDATPYTLALCRQVTGSGANGVDYGWDVIIQRRAGNIEATVIRGRADANSNTNLRKIWSAIP